MSDEQREATPTTAATAPTAAAAPAPPRWGDPLNSIPAARQVKLRALANMQHNWVAQDTRDLKQSAFYGQRLSGADAFFLAAYSLAGSDGDLEAQAARLRAIKRDELSTRVALPDLHLEGADLYQQHLEGADFRAAHLEDVFLRAAHLEGADLSEAHLERADFRAAHLERANLGEAHLEDAFLHKARLEGTDLYRAHLESANLREAWLDSKTVLSEAILDGKTQLADIHWSGVGAVNLTQIRWERVPRLGDALSLDRPDDIAGFERVVRAYRQLATQLRAQGMSEVADRFSYRAQVWQRILQRQQQHWGGYLFSLLLWGMAGYGYQLRRIAFTYGSVVAMFAACYLVSDLASGTVVASGPSLAHGVLDALQISLNAIHGRVFFVQFGLDTLQSWLATIESIFGIVIEGVFVAMLIQRFFGTK